MDSQSLLIMALFSRCVLYRYTAIYPALTAIYPILTAIAWRRCASLRERVQ